MKVYDLGCEADHRFEGWFGSADAFESQRSAGQIECPMCGSHAVRRLPSATRLNLGHGAPGKAGAAGVGDPEAAADRPRHPAEAAPPPAITAAEAARHAVHAAWLRMARRVMATTEDVGERFADEARRIHHDEAPARPIRGVATARQAAELADEGIEVMALPLPVAAKEPLQ